MQYRCGDPPLFVSDDWWLVTNAHVVCREGTTELVSEAFVEFFHQVGETPLRVDVDLSTRRLLSHLPEGYPPSLDRLGIAVFK